MPCLWLQHDLVLGLLVSVEHELRVAPRLSERLRDRRRPVGWEAAEQIAIVPAQPRYEAAPSRPQAVRWVLGTEGGE